jgi:hypothetical protein
MDRGLATTVATYLPSDLQRRYRAILDEAREGQARVRDVDGANILLLPETEVEALRRVGAAAANLAVVERVLESMSDRAPDVAEYGAWTWLRMFGGEDLRLFVQDIRDGIIVAVREGSTELLDEQLRAWRVTAQQAEDPLFRDLLLGGARDEDFVDVSRPEGGDRGTQARKDSTAEHGGE